MHTQVEIVDEHVGRAVAAGMLDRRLGCRPGVAVFRDGFSVTVCTHNPASTRTWLDMDGRARLTWGHRLILAQ